MAAPAMAARGAMRSRRPGRPGAAAARPAPYRPGWRQQARRRLLGRGLGPRRHSIGARGEERRTSVMHLSNSRSTRRLRALGTAVVSSGRQHWHSASGRTTPTAPNSCSSEAAESNANLSLEQHIFLFDLQGFLVIEDVLTPAAVRQFNKLIDARGIVPGQAEVLAADGSAGSKVRFGSNGGGTKNTGPGLLDWGQPFVDLLDHPTVVPLLSALMPRSDGLGTVSAGVRLDRLYGIHQDRVSSGILPTGSGLGGFHRDYEGTYGVKNGVVQNSFVVAAWALSDSGGACGAVPGDVLGSGTSALADCSSAP